MVKIASRFQRRLADEVNVAAIGRERQAEAIILAQRGNLDVTVRGQLLQPETLLACRLPHVGHVLAIG